MSLPRRLVRGCGLPDLVIVGAIIVIGAVIAVQQSGETAQDVSARVPWRDYSPAVRKRIETWAVRKDCFSLQHEFDVADANNETTARHTGHNNSALMAYIEASLHEAGCYK